MRMAEFRKRGNALYVAIRKKGFQPVYRTFDNTPQGRREADEFVDAIEHQMKYGRYVENDNANEIPLRDALDKYLSEVTPSKKGAKAERNRIIKLCKMPLTDRKMSELTSVHIATFRDQMLAEGYAPSTIKNYITIISQCYVLAMSEWGITGLTNPVQGVKRPAENKGRDRRLKYGEEQIIFDALSEPYKYYFSLLLETAMRRGELCKLEWKDVHISQRFAVLRDTKNGETRSVPLSSKAVEALSKLYELKEGEQVATAKADVITHNFKRACTENGIDDLRLHDLRHEATSRLFELGTLDLMEIASITGHKDLRMLKRYTHLNASKLASKLG